MCLGNSVKPAHKLLQQLKLKQLLSHVGHKLVWVVLAKDSLTGKHKTMSQTFVFFFTTSFTQSTRCSVLLSSSSFPHIYPETVTLKSRYAVQYNLSPWRTVKMYNPCVMFIINFSNFCLPSIYIKSQDASRIPFPHS